MPQQSCLAGCRGSNTATKRKLEEEWKVRWIKYQQQTGALADDSKLSVAARATWTRGLRTKENLTRAGSTIATLLRTEHIGLHNYLFRRRVPGYLKANPDCGAAGRDRLPKTSFCSILLETTCRDASKGKDDRSYQATIDGGGVACGDEMVLAVGCPYPALASKNGE